MITSNDKSRALRQQSQERVGVDWPRLQQNGEGELRRQAEVATVQDLEGGVVNLGVCPRSPLLAEYLTVGWTLDEGLLSDPPTLLYTVLHASAHTGMLLLVPEAGFNYILMPEHSGA